MIKHINFTTHLYFENKTIREFLEFYAISKSNIYKLETYKLLLINQEFKKFDYLLKEHDMIAIDFSDLYQTNIMPHPGKIDLIYEDLDILIVNKPPKLLVHPDGNEIDTLANRVLYYYKNKSYPYPVLPTHRIDFDTSGMVIFAKHGLAHAYLSSLFERHEIFKTYHCLCMHEFTDLKGEIVAKIGRDRHSNKQVITQTGKDAITKYKVIHTENKVSKVEITILGGRKHQIRVHLASISHPILGDQLYGSNQQSNRLMLHFSKVSFIHPRSLSVKTYHVPEPF